MSYFIVNKKSAFALSITIWIVASIMLATAVLLRFSRDYVQLSSALNDKLETKIIAEDVLSHIKYYVFTADYKFDTLSNTFLSTGRYKFPEDIIVDGREYPLANGITISLKDTSGMLNVTTSPSAQIAYILTQNRENSLQQLLSDSLDDWRDSDNVRKANGAEKAYYKSLIKEKKSIIIRNKQDIQDINELMLIKGFRDVGIKKIQDNLFYGRANFINLTLMNKRYLASVLGISDRYAKELIALKEISIDDFIKEIYKIENFNDDFMGFSMSKQLLITIIVRRKRAKSIIRTIIDFKGMYPRAYFVVSYKSL